MQHVVTVPMEPVRLPCGLVLHQVPAAHDNLVWLLEAPDGTAAAVDGPFAAPVLEACARLGLRLTTILTTHTHGDHVGLHHDLAGQGLLEGLRVVGCADRRAEIPGLNEAVDEGDVVVFGGATLRVWRTEGHQAHHLSYVTEGAVFCGDVMFAGGCGRIFEGTPAQLFASLLRLAELPADTLVCCAHEYTAGNLVFGRAVEPDNAALAERASRVTAVLAEGRSAVPSTIGEERATNVFLRPGAAGVRATVAGWGVAEDAGWVEVFAAVRGAKDRGWVG